MKYQYYFLECFDTPLWDDGHGNGCHEYINRGWCANGEVTNEDRKKNKIKFRYPNRNCCNCGKNYPGKGRWCKTFNRVVSMSFIVRYICRLANIFNVYGS